MSVQIGEVEPRRPCQRSYLQEWLIANRAVELEHASETHRRIRDAVVSVMWHPKSPDGSNGGPQICSGFVFNVSGRWVLITADHAVDDVLNRTEPGSLRISKNGDPFGQPIFFHPSEEDTVRLKQHAAETLAAVQPQTQQMADLLEHLSELDIVAIWLEDLYSEALTKAGVRPFGWTEVLDLGSQAEPLDGSFEFLVCGFPASNVELETRGHSQELHLLPVNFVGQDGNRFVFEPNWPTDLRPGGVKGMSGGPVAAVNSDHVRLVGVQSSQFGIEGKTPTKLFVAPAYWFLKILEDVEAERTGSSS